MKKKFMLSIGLILFCILFLGCFDDEYLKNTVSFQFKGELITFEKGQAVRPVYDSMEDYCQLFASQTSSNDSMPMSYISLEFYNQYRTQIFNDYDYLEQFEFRLHGEYYTFLYFKILLQLSDLPGFDKGVFHGIVEDDKGNIFKITKGLFVLKK